MKRWLKIAVPLGIAAVLVSLLAVGGSGRTRATTLPCAGDASASATFESQIVYDGTATPAGDAHSFRFCGEDTAYLFGFVSWNGSKDLKVTLVSPDGTTYLFDAYSTVSLEYVRVGSPLAHGDWQMIVSTKEKGKAHYHVDMQFR